MQLRNLVTHGYEQQGHSAITLHNVRWYRATGHPKYIVNTRYAKIREGLLKGSITS
jgi:hypothetical protein